jgi:hypothetical protein
MVVFEFGERPAIACTNRAKQFLGLTMELVEIWPDR